VVIVDNRIRWCNAVSGEVIASVDQTFGGVRSLALSVDGAEPDTADRGKRKSYKIFHMHGNIPRHMVSIKVGASRRYSKWPACSFLFVVTRRIRLAMDRTFAIGYTPLSADKRNHFLATRDGLDAISLQDS